MPNHPLPPSGISAAVEQAAHRAIQGYDRLSTKTIRMVLEAVEPLIWDQAIRAYRVDADVALIAEVLDQHHVSVDWFRRRNGWAWWCSCLTDGEEVYPDGDSARTAGARHQAEAVWEAIQHGAPEAPAAEPATTVEAPGQPVPAAMEVG